jgi:hypothetical protein
MSNSTTAIEAHLTEDRLFPPPAAFVAQADGSTAIVEACRLITEGSMTAAAAVIRQQYPFFPSPKSARRYTYTQMTQARK